MDKIMILSFVLLFLGTMGTVLEVNTGRFSYKTKWSTLTKKQWFYFFATTQFVFVCIIIFAIKINGMI